MKPCVDVDLADVVLVDRPWRVQTPRNGSNGRLGEEVVAHKVVVADDIVEVAVGCLHLRCAGEEVDRVPVVDGAGVAFGARGHEHDAVVHKGALENDGRVRQTKDDEGGEAETRERDQQLDNVVVPLGRREAGVQIAVDLVREDAVETCVWVRLEYVLIDLFDLGQEDWHGALRVGVVDRVSTKQRDVVVIKNDH